MTTRSIHGENVRCFTPDGHWGLRGIPSIYGATMLTVTNGTTNYDVKSTGGMFTTWGASIVGATARFVSMRTDQTITVRFNSTANDAITMTAAGSPYEIELEITNIYITNASGASAYIYTFID